MTRKQEIAFAFVPPTSPETPDWRLAERLGFLPKLC